MTPCRLSAHCLQNEALYGTLQEAGERIAASTHSRRTGVGISLLQDTHTLFDDVLNQEALARIWLCQSEIDGGMKRLLKGRGLWRSR